MYAASDSQIPVYRVYNLNAKRRSHHFTIDKREYDSLEKAGWKKEGIAFYVNSADSLIP